MLEDILVAIALLVALVVGAEAGFRLGKGKESGGPGQVGTIQAAMLGLLALLLGFSFSTAGARFLERQDLIVTEANAIGTSYLRADLLDEPHRSELKTALRRYVDRRLEVSKDMKSGLTAEQQSEIGRMQGEIWKAASTGASGKPELIVSVLPPINDVIDLHSTRLAAAKKHLPWMVLTLLILCSILSLGVIGYGAGISGGRNTLLTFCLSFLIASTLWLIVDLDHPRSGFMQLSDAPLKMLQADMK